MYHKIPSEIFDFIFNEMYPVRLGILDQESNEEESPWDTPQLREQLLIALENNVLVRPKNARQIVNDFCLDLNRVKKRLDEDLRAIRNGDPAAKSDVEIVLTYPGFYAIAAYRVANALDKHEVPLYPRLITEHAHSQTGIDIHPSAQIGRSFFIDHGTGIVIGETTVIGDHVKLYQGVTLGGLSPKASQHGTKRHPTIEDNVILYAGATVLGDVTVGEGSILGGNVWITESVPSNSTVYYKPNIEQTQKSARYEVA